MRKYQATCVFLCLAIGGSQVNSEDWAIFRGPYGDGHVPDVGRPLPVQWSGTENVVWKQALAGEGWSSPVVVRDRIFLTAAVPQPRSGISDYSLRLVCLAADTGQPIYDREVFREDGSSAPKIHSKNSHASPTPLVAGERIYVHFGHEGTACLDWEGQPIWQNRELRYAPVHGAGGTPILVDGLLVFSCDGAEQPFIVGLDATTGEVRWKTPRVTDAAKKFSFATATVIDVEGRKQVISPGSNAVSALDAVTGQELWRVRYDGYSVIPKPVYGNGFVYVCTGYNRPTLLAIQPTGSGDVTETHVQWTYKSNVPHTPSLVLVDQNLFMVSDAGIASCLDARTGKQIWQERLGGNYSASPLVSRGLIYFQSEDGVTKVVRASPAFEVVATSSLAERTLASFAARDGALFLRGDKHLYRIEQP